jgi:hypothetical protein
MRLCTLFLFVALQQMPPQPMPHHDTGVWWTHWGWMLLWIVLAIILVLAVVLVVRGPRPPRR